jgi:A/G-specific adenine glycosylase
VNKKYLRFREGLMEWHRRHNSRSLPWKGERDPYKIWLSEIMLQQTRAEQGLPYYLRYVAAYPTVQDLAATEDDAAFKLWQGLGYYARCRNMLATARQITNEYEGVFPDTYEGLLGLKGVGPYTAAAIASFAYGLPKAVVDGNVYRVLARYFGISTPTDSTEGKKCFQQLADEVLDRTDSAAFNQAMMDHGATICTPANPKCDECPVAAACVARAEGLVALLPVKGKKVAVRKRYFHYIMLVHEGEMYLRVRSGKDIWKGLYEPLMIEADAALDVKGLQQSEPFRKLDIAEVPQYEGMLSQKLTHQIIESRFFNIHSDKRPSLADGIWVEMGRLKEYPFPKTLLSFFEKKKYF